MVAARVSLCCLILLLLGGCALPIHPGFPISESQALSARDAMKQRPKALERPLVIIGGYRAPYHVQVRTMTGRLIKMTSQVRADALGVSVMYDGSIESATDHVIRNIEAMWPSDDPDMTVEVDVVGVSMGGLVARHGAVSGIRSDGSMRKRLRIARLYTVATPHLGACLADSLTPDYMTRQMKKGSAFLTALDEADADRAYEMFCYARTNDAVVGATRTAPIGMSPYWVHGPWMLSHVTVARDWRICADIARRLRGESPLSLEASAPPKD